MTLDLDAITARAEAATEGPWSTSQSTRNSRLYGINEPLGYVTLHAETVTLNDAEFIAHARQDVPALVAEVHRLTALVVGQVTDD